MFDAVRRWLAPAPPPPAPGAASRDGDAVQRWIAEAQALVAAGRYAEARETYGQALRQEPGHLVALLGRANCLLALARNAEALAEYEQLLALHPRSPQAWLNRGNALLGLHRDDEALDAFQQALSLRPDYVEALVNLAGLLQARNRFPEAVAAYREAIALDPASAAAHWNLALCLLVLGRLDEGWAEAEWRWQALERTPLKVPQPQWSGREPLAGRTVLLYAEQGLGDTLQFCRHVPQVVERGARVLLRVQPPLRRLLATLPAPCTFVDDGQPLPPFDLQCPLMSLPLALQTRLESIPAPVPYLRAQPATAARWRDRVAPLSGLRVGIAWSGNPTHVNDRNRSVALASMLALAGEGVSLVSLQKDVRAEDAPALAASGVADFGALLTDFDETAALAECMDLVVTVDTSVAHLAGALGKPTWILLPYSPDWRWLLHRDTSPWYPSVRLFRQPRRGDWASVFEEVGEALRERVRGPAHPAADPAAIEAARALVTQGNALEDAGQVPAACDRYRDAVARAPGWPGGHLNLGLGLLAAGDADGAEQCLRRVLALDPAHPFGCYNYASLCYGRGDLPRAEELLRRALAAKPDFPQALLLLAGVLDDRGRPQDALPLVEQALRLAPGHAGAERNRTLLLQKLGAGHDNQAAQAAARGG